MLNPSQQGQNFEDLNDSVGTNQFIKAWTSAECSDTPYPHMLLKDLIDPAVLHDINDIPMEVHDLDYQEGSREEFNAYRRYFNPEFMEKHPAAKHIADVFRSKSVIEQIEKTGGISLKDSLLRIEYTVDAGKFWLQPHTDIGVKLFTMLIYMTPDGDENWGTDIYADAETHVLRPPYIFNTALQFYPAENTWHGFEKRELNGIRKSLIVNFVTQDWRNRQELTHPTQSVYG
jgi:hypothetical protein